MAASQKRPDEELEPKADDNLVKRYNKSMQLSRIDGKSVPFVMGSSNPPAQLQASNKFQNARSKDYNMDLEQTIRSQFENTGNQKAAMQNAISQMQPLSCIQA